TARSDTFAGETGGRVRRSASLQEISTKAPSLFGACLLRRESDMSRRTIGTEADFGQLPAEVVIGNHYYYLVKEDQDGFRLVSRVCPHAGGEVHYDQQDQLMFCPLHYWIFDAQSGVCTNVPGACLSTVPVQVENGILYIEEAV